MGDRTFAALAEAEAAIARVRALAEAASYDAHQITEQGWPLEKAASALVALYSHALTAIDAALDGPVAP